MSLHALKNQIMFYFLSTIISSVLLLLLGSGDAETNLGPKNCPTFVIGT